MPSEIPLSSPDITDAEVAAVVAALRSGRLTMGPRQVRFEEMVAERCGRRHGVAVSSGTAGLHLALVALGIGAGDEVITSPFTFVAAANAIAYTGARPVFVDIDPGSMNMCAAGVEAALTPRTKAVLAVETFGNPAGVDRLAAIAQQHEVPLIEDACEALGGRYRGKPVGSFGRVAVFSFYPNQQLTTGEGGMIVTDDDRLADMCRSLRNHGRPAEGNNPDPTCPGSVVVHERLGFSYRLSELHAAMGIAQMERLDEVLQLRRDVACRYFERLMACGDLILPNVLEVSETSWFAFVVRLSDLYTARERDRILTGLRRHDVGCSNYFPPIHLQPYFKQSFGYKAGDFPVAEAAASRTIALPFFTRMEPTQIELTCLTLNVMLQREQLLRPQA